MNQAKHSLVEVTDLINNGKVVFLAQSRSIDQVILMFPKMNRNAAEEYILNHIKKLAAQDFAERIMQWDIILDVYGKLIDGLNWYIKFGIEQDENAENSLSEVSFHPIQDDLKLADGKILKKG